ncbi:unnamed protein product [Euphydryas editha]|uniref:Kazal-like domain-containing protein n=1 Tax=Euphydryas editha TaxID=104508 RepID=A0AAU9UDB0_EUPED|nr:unnamed protein product [Euphydryas editha]
MNFLSYIIYYNGNILYNPFRLNPEIDPYTNGQKIFGMMPPPFFNIDDANSEAKKAYSCSLMPCFDDDNMVVCACNFNTGNVVSFKNKCDVLKHNCRFDTEFRIILNEICPWEFQSRRNNKEFNIDYNNPKYYN